MFRRISHLSVAISALLLTVGCVHISELETSQRSISFDVKTALLKGGASTKGATPKTSFSNDDTFYVYGSKTISNVKETVFSGDQVRYNSFIWTYSPLKFWDSNATRHDFLCISGPATKGGITCNPSSNPITAVHTYDPTASQYDLMVASAYRQGDDISPVQLNFSHVLSAVSVTIHNDSPLQEIRVNSYGFKNICTQKTLTVEQYDNISSVSWASPGYNRNVVLGSPTANTTISPAGGYYPTQAITDLMIPQELNIVAVYRPTFVLDYQYTEIGAAEPTHIVTNILLEEIEMVGSTEYITEWVQGKHYHYDIHIRIGGGIHISVVATDWEIINAETPGLTI